VISEEVNEDEEIMEEIKQLDKNNDEVEEEPELKQHCVEMNIFPLDVKLKKSSKFQAICHTYFIVKDKGMEINWRKPLL
jgi:hypothetical protein